MKKGFKKSLGLALFLFISFLPAINVEAPHALAVNANITIPEQLNEIIKKDPLLKGAVAGISIRSASTGELLFEHNGQIRLRPASNMKLLTAAAALSVLGKDFSFTTEVLTDGRQKGKTLDGNLYLKGKGDPTLLKEDFTDLAKEIKQNGISSIKGDLIGDDTWYDDVRLSPDLIWSDEHMYYGAQVSALTVSPNEEYDAGTVLLEIGPGQKIGEKAAVHVTPPTNYIKIVNNGVTVSPDSNSSLKVQREHGTNTVTVEGMIPMKSMTKREWIAVWEPTGYALDLFQQSLAEQGIEWEGKIRVGKAPEKGEILALHKSIPLSELLVPFMKLSNNGHAEILVKEMGKASKGEGSWELGLKVLTEQLPKLGVNPDTVVIRDGSGISHLDLIPANEISNLLFHIQREPWFQSYLHSLPVGGKSGRMIGGTLRNRMKSPPMVGNVHAKTGTLTTISSLSGFVRTKSGEMLIFSILLNNLLDEEKGKELEDKIVTILGNQ